MDEMTVAVADLPTGFYSCMFLVWFGLEVSDCRLDIYSRVQTTSQTLYFLLEKVYGPLLHLAGNITMIPLDDDSIIVEKLTIILCICNNIISIEASVQGLMIAQLAQLAKLKAAGFHPRRTQLFS